MTVRFQNCRWLMMLVIGCWALMFNVTAAERYAITGEFRVNQAFDNRPIPLWNNGRLIHYDDNIIPATIFVFDAQGTLATKAELRFPNAPAIRISGIALSSVGRIAVSGTALGEGRYTNFIAWVTPSGSVEFIVRPDGFSAGLLSFAADGTLWAFGGPPASTVTSYQGRLPHDMLQHYDANGRLIQSALPYSAYVSGGGPGQGGRHPSARAMMTAIPDRIGIVMMTARVWVEFSPTNGTVIGRWALPLVDSDQRLYGAALTAKGNAYLALENVDSDGVTVFKLNRTSGDWAPVDATNLLAPQGKWLQLFGSNGEDLVITNEWGHYLMVRATE